MTDTMNILLANVNPSYLEVTKRMLKYQNEDYHFEGVTSVEDCLEKIFSDGFDAVLIDGDLLNGDGLEVLEKVRDINQEIPVILTINEHDSMLAEKIRDLGTFNLVFKKKGYLSSLPTLLKEAVENQRKQQEEELKVAAEPIQEVVKQKPQPETENVLEQGYFILDRRGRFLSANDFIQNTTRYSQEELLELLITDLMSDEQEREYYSWISRVRKEGNNTPLRVELLDKVGEGHPLEMSLKPFLDDRRETIGYKGRALPLQIERSSPLAPFEGEIDQERMVSEIINAIQTCYNEPLNVLLERMAEIICQVFGFYRSTVALLDRRRRSFIKQAMVGYMTGDVKSIEQRAVEVPQDVIDRIFSDRFKIKVIYYTQDKRNTGDYISPGVPERRTQKRRPDDQWHKRDLVLLNLTDRGGNTFGYISLDDPVEGNAPNRSTFYNLELFASLTSIAIENYYRFSALERRSRRLKQVLVTSNIFKLHLSLSELLKEVVWSVKFSLDFNMVALILISKKTGMLETKAVACDDKIKMLQLRELKYDLKEFGELLKDDYRRGKSYMIHEEEPVLKTLKRIYYGSQWEARLSDGWPYWGALLVPLKSREGKIIGFLLVDDPADRRIPGADTVHTLEILSNQIAVAIDNRVMYVQAKEQLHEVIEKPEEHEHREDGIYQEEYPSGGLKKLVEKFLR